MSTHGRRRRLNKRKESKHVDMGAYLWGTAAHWVLESMENTQKMGRIKPEGKRVPSMIRVPGYAIQNEISSLNLDMVVLRDHWYLIPWM